MNIITDKLPESVGKNGRQYPVRTDFKVWLKFYEIMKDNKKSPAEKFTEAVLCCFDSAKCKSLPDSYEETMSLLFDFFAGVPKGEKQNKPKEKVFDFSEDAEYIFASFFSEYGIDISEKSMHWYKFLALLAGLSESSPLKKAVMWRGVNLTEIEDPKRRNYCRKMKEFYRLNGGDAAVLDEGDIAAELLRAF